MAAPTIPSSKKHANLNKLISKENTPKVTRKNILCPAPEEWPRPSAAVEDEILKKLTESLKDQVNIVKSTKKTSDEDRSEKSKIRSQLEIGVSSVFRALERDMLACVLVSGQATPAVAVDHVISLGRERGCPVLCLDQLAPSVARATQSRWHPLALGFKKLEAGARSDFAEVMSIIVENATVTPPKISPYSSSNHLLSGRKLVPKFGTSKYKPLRINMALETEILGDLKRIFSKMLASKDKDKDLKKKKKKKQKKKENLKGVFDKVYHSHFEIGKRTVTGTLERGKLQLVLVTEEILPVLLSEDLSCSLLSVAASKRCPVVVMPGLAGAMRTVCGGNVSVLGFKKEASTKSNLNDFKPVIEKCLQAITDPHGGFITQEYVPVDIQSTCGVQECAAEGQSIARADHECDSHRHFAGTGTNKDNTDTVAGIRANKDNAGIVAEIRANKDSTGTFARTGPNKDNTETVPGTKANKAKTETSMDSIHNETSKSDEEEDYSYLYILKKDSKELAEVKCELNAAVKSATAKDAFTADFISFSQGLDQDKAESQNYARKLKAGTPGFRNSGSVHSKKAKSIGSRSVDSKQTVVRNGDFKDSPDSSSASSNIDNGRSANRASVSPLFTLSRSGDLVDVSPAFTISRSGDLPNVSPAFTMSRSGDSESTLTLSQSTNSSKVLPAFTISRSGDSQAHTNATKLTAQREAKNSSQDHHDEFALGMKELSQSKDTRTTGIDYIALGESSKKAKKTLKRKLQGDSSFISFAYTEANIQTMVSDPSKKRKKKKKC